MHCCFIICQILPILANFCHWKKGPPKTHLPPPSSSPHFRVTDIYVWWSGQGLPPRGSMKKQFSPCAFKFGPIPCGFLRCFIALLKKNAASGPEKSHPTSSEIFLQRKVSCHLIPWLIYPHYQNIRITSIISIIIITSSPWSPWPSRWWR